MTWKPRNPRNRFLDIARQHRVAPLKYVIGVGLFRGVFFQKCD